MTFCGLELVHVGSGASTAKTACFEFPGYWPRTSVFGHFSRGGWPDHSQEKICNVQALPGIARRFQGPRLLKLRAGFSVISACLLYRPISAFASSFPLLIFWFHLLIFLLCSIVEAVDHFLVVRDLKLHS